MASPVEGDDGTCRLESLGHSCERHGRVTSSMQTQEHMALATCCVYRHVVSASLHRVEKLVPRQRLVQVAQRIFSAATCPSAHGAEYVRVGRWTGHPMRFLRVSHRRDCVAHRQQAFRHRHTTAFLLSALLLLFGVGPWSVGQVIHNVIGCVVLLRADLLRLRVRKREIGDFIAFLIIIVVLVAVSFLFLLFGGLLLGSLGLILLHLSQELAHLCSSQIGRAHV